MLSVKEHLKARGLLPMHENQVVIDEENRTATFMLFSETGKYLGYQAYKPEGKKTSEGKGFNPKDLRYFTHAVPGEMPMFGAESLSFQHGVLFVVEGVFDAVKFHALGIPCLAVLGNDPVRLRSYLRATGRCVFGFCDNDKAGLRLASSCNFLYVSPGTDAGDMTSEELAAHLSDGQLYQMIDGELCELPNSSNIRYALQF